MNVVPFVHEGLGNSSYLVELSEGRAALVDPDRSVGRYLQASEARGWKIVSIFETHLHADFVSGAREAASTTGARIFLPEGADSRLAHHALAAGDRLNVESAEVEAVASPGHTPEHLSYVFRKNTLPPDLFSGGSLIVGGAARTDLISPEMTGALTRAQFRTVKTAFSHLPGETLLFPTHGGGSFCSSGAASQRISTLDQERAANPLLSFADEEEFARWFPTTFPGVPSYFSRMRPLNQAGPRLRRDIALAAPLSPSEFEAARHDALVIDVRPQRAYSSAHIPGSLAIPFQGAYATWLGWLVPPDRALLFVVGGVPVDLVVEESLLVGYERFGGWLVGGVEAWVAAGLPVQHLTLVDAREARKTLLAGAAALDVREPDEFVAGHIEGAIHVPLGMVQASLDKLPKDRPIVTYCGEGQRSTSAVSILEQAGFASLLNLDGGVNAWREAAFPLASTE